MAFCFRVVCAVATLMAALASAVSLSPPKQSPLSTPLVEVLHVSGCEFSSSPRRETFGCVADGKTRITIRGRGFDDYGNSVVLEESASSSIGKQQSAKAPPKLQAVCTQTHVSVLLPQQILFCTLPTLTAFAPSVDAATAANDHVSDAGDEASPLTLTGTKWFDVVIRIRSGHGAVLRRAIQFKFSAGSDSPTSSDSENNELAAFERNDWLALGIGGLGRAFQELYRRAFVSRTSAAASIASSIGVQHVRGVILHGPPGTGKTLIARTVAKMLKARSVQVINGPEIMSKFVGDSEKNLRSLFSAADSDAQRNGEAAQLHVIIFDEIDAILRPRGEGDDSAARAVYDGVTTQMLAYMDGIHSRSNILIIGLTNRLDALDKALLRPGRFEVQIRIPLPDADGRKQIFAIHTKPLKANRYLSPQIDFDFLASETSSFSGADIAGVVRSAISFALARYGNESRQELAESTASPSGAASGRNTQVEPACTPGESSTPQQCTSPPVDPNKPTQRFQVTQKDLLDGIDEILASKGAASNLSPYLRNGVIMHSPDTTRTVERLMELNQVLQNTSQLRKLIVCLNGHPGSGTTTLAALFARLSRASYVQLINLNTLQGLTVAEKQRRLSQAFDTADHVPNSVIILDKLEDVIEMNLGRRPLDKVSSELMSLMMRDPVATGSATVSNSKTLILVTTSKQELQDQFGSVAYDSVVSVSDAASESVESMLCAYKIVTNVTAARALASVIARNVPVKRLAFLIHAAHGLSVASGDDGAIETQDSTKLKPAGDTSNQLRWGDGQPFRALPLSELCSGADSSNDLVLHQFVKVLKSFGHYSSKKSIQQRAAGLFL